MDQKPQERELCEVIFDQIFGDKKKNGLLHGFKIYDIQ